MIYISQKLKLFHLAIILIIGINGFSQTLKPGGFDLIFTQYLIDNDQFNEAEFVINKHLSDSDSLLFSDTASYLKGMIYYRQKKLSESAKSFLNVRPQSDYYLLSQFVAGYELAHLNDLPGSKMVFENIKTGDSLLLELKNYQLASLSILENNSDSYNKYSSCLTNKYFQLKEQEQMLDNIYKNTKEFNPKSPALAGLMSAVIPGSGKMYAGKLGEGITAFLGLGILGAITYENFSKAGPTNYKTIAFGSLFTIFYISNIYGSVYSVKVYRDEHYKTIQNAVLFNMHIPVRNIFKGSFK